MIALIALGLTGMAKALEDQRRQPDVATLPFEERLAMMIDREAIERENKRLERRLKAASLRQSAIVEDIDHKAPRGLDRALFQKLMPASGSTAPECSSSAQPESAKVGLLARSATRPAATTAPSSIIACPGCSMRWRSLGEARLLKNLARADLLILDDWALAPLTPEQARDLLEIIDDRHGRGSTIVTSQLPVDHWHEVIGNPTIADAILDRLVHNAHRLKLKGDSMRKIAAKRSGLDASPAL